MEFIVVDFFRLIVIKIYDGNKIENLQKTISLDIFAKKKIDFKLARDAIKFEIFFIRLRIE